MAGKGEKKGEMGGLVKKYLKRSCSRNYNYY